MANFGDYFGDIGRSRSHLTPKLLVIDLLDVGLDRLYPGPVGWRAAAFMTAIPPDLGSLGLGVSSQFLGRASLTDTWLAYQHDQPPATGKRIIQGES
jgi:hypothetical protein